MKIKKFNLEKDFKRLETYLRNQYLENKNMTSWLPERLHDLIYRMDTQYTNEGNPKSSDYIFIWEDNDKIVGCILPDGDAIYMSIKKGYEDLYKSIVSYAETNCKPLFKKEDLFNYWLELILFNPYVYLKSNDFIEILDQFSVKDKESFFSLIDKEWINNNGLKDNDHTSFLKFLGIRFTIGINYRNEEIIDLLKKERNDYFSYAENKRINNSIINDTEFGKYKKKIGDSFKKTINDYSLLDKSLDLLNAEKMYYSILIETENLDSFIDMNIKQLANAISNLMRIRLLKSNIKKTNLKDYIFSNEEINDVIAFNPDLMSSHSSIFYKCDSEQKNILKKFPKLTIILYRIIYFGKIMQLE